MTELREARLVLPRDVKPAPDDVHGKLRVELARTFGGYTCTQGRGGWVDGTGTTIEELNWIYDIAMRDEFQDFRELKHIAVEYGRLLDQQAVYIRFPGGQVEIIEIDQRPGANVGTGERQAKTAKPAGTVEQRKIDGKWIVLKDGAVIGGSHATEDEALAWAEKFEQATTPGARRVPAVGDIWDARDGTRVAVLSPASVLDGGFNCISLTQGKSAIRPGYPYVTDLDGKVLRGGDGDSPFDLVRFVKAFVD